MESRLGFFCQTDRNMEHIDLVWCEQFNSGPVLSSLIFQSIIQIASDRFPNRTENQSGRLRPQPQNAVGDLQEFLYALSHKTRKKTGNSLSQYAIRKIRMSHNLKLSWNEVQADAPLMIYCKAASTSYSYSVSCITFYFRNGVLDSVQISASCGKKLTHMSTNIMTNPNPIEDLDVFTVPILYKRFTNRVTQSVLLNTKLDLFVRSNLFRTYVKVRALYF